MIRSNHGPVGIADAYWVQWTPGFHIANMPAGLYFKIQACSE